MAQDISENVNMQFVKMHGLGNDFVIIDERTQVIPILTPHHIQDLADRRKGIGCDQVILIGHSNSADVFMSIYNADGSPSGACGNGTRCVAAYLNQTECSIQTEVGILKAWLRPDDKIVVDMGPGEVGMKVIDLQIDDLPPAVKVNVGNPHAVVFVDNAEKIDMAKYGPLVQEHPDFDEKPNVEFATINSGNKIRMRVWERGVGETPACGTGACATAIAAIAHGILPKGSKVEVELDGGKLLISWDAQGNVIQTGPAMKAFKGEFVLD